MGSTTPGNFVAGSNVCIVGKLSSASSFAEQVQILSVSGTGGPGGTQTVTFNTRYEYAGGFLMMQGGMCGQYATPTITPTWRSPILAIGSTSSNNIIIAPCTHGVCTSSAVQQPSYDLYLQTNYFLDPLHGTTYYPGAEIIGTMNNTTNKVELATNTVNWTTGDVIENPNMASVNTLGLHIIAGQKTALNDSGAGTAWFEWSGSALASAVVNVIAAGPANSLILAANGQGGTLNPYVDVIHVAGNAPGSAVMNLQDTASSFAVGWLKGSSADGYPELVSYNHGLNWRFDVLGGSGYTALDASNVPPVPSAAGQIPIATDTANGTLNHPDYTPTTLTGDVTITASGVSTVGKIGGVAVIPNVQLVLPTSSVPAHACTSASTVSMPGVMSTTTFAHSFSTDADGVVGWGGTGGLAMDMWPTVNTLHWKVCNQTAAAIAPGAITLNVSAR